MRRILMALALVLAGVGSPAARAQDDRFDIGVRYVLLTAGGEPTNDQSGVGVIAGYHLNERWLVGIAIDRLSGDFERPYELFGSTSPEEIDSSVESTIFSALVERQYRADKKLRWFWSASLGFTSPDVDDVTGPLTGGGTFDITTDAGSETILGVAGGLRYHFAKWCALEVGARADQHFADWKLTDRATGATATLDDYTTFGLNAGVRFSF